MKRTVKSMIIPVVLGLIVCIVVIVPLATLVNDDNGQGGEDDKGQQGLENSQQAPECNHTAATRGCWSDGFDVYTDYETKTPTTGRTRRYDFTISERDNVIGGDGVFKTKAMLVNGQFPGPVIRADWGDFIEVTVTNALNVNGTAIHWHGIRQLNNNINDGTNGVTECAIPPGGSKVYRFRAEQYGTSWYHSHFASQYANGVAGPVIIDGPASHSYDIDLGVLTISDWYYNPADLIATRIMDPSNPFVPGVPGSLPGSDNILFNGKHVNNINGGGEYYKVVLTPGKRHRLRLINPSVDNTFTVKIQGHNMTIISNDFVPLRPEPVDSIFLGVGQRFDVTIDADQPLGGNFWLNVTFSLPQCGRSKMLFPAAIIHYEGSPDQLPTEQGTPPPNTFCADKTGLIPVVQRNAPQSGFEFSPDIDLQVVSEINGEANRVYWKVNLTAIDVAWDEPTLEYVKKRNVSYPASANIIQVPNASKWVYWVVENASPIPHPLHLHGHDFLILGQSPPLADPINGRPRPFNPGLDTPGLVFNNPTRRDTTMLPAFGWVVIAFQTDNPGAWLFHCHVAWHVSQGLSVQFLERVDEIETVMDLSTLDSNCASWTNYYATSPFKKYDSGLKR